MALRRAGYDALAVVNVVRLTAANRSRSADTVWLRRCAWLSQPTPFSSTYETSRVLATSRYRPTTQPHDSVENPRMRTTLIDLFLSLPKLSKSHAGPFGVVCAREMSLPDRVALSESGSSYTSC